MNQSLSTLVLAGLLTGAGAQNAPAQAVLSQAAPAKIRPDRSNLIDSQITLGFDYPPIARKAFLNTPLIPMPRGTVLPTQGVLGAHGMDRMLSRQQHDFTIGPRAVRYPVVAMMRCSNFPDTGEFVMVIASTTSLKADVKAGEALHTGGFLLEARRGFHAGETIPSVRVIFRQKQFVFSLEEAPGTPSAAVQPLLSIAQEHLSAADRDIALEAWRLSNQSARQGGLN